MKFIHKASLMVSAVAIGLAAFATANGNAMSQRMAVAEGDTIDVPEVPDTVPDPDEPVVDDHPRKVTYVVEFNGQRVKTYSTESTNGTQAQLPDSLQFGAYATFDYSPAVISRGTDTIVAKLNWAQSAPIQFSNADKQYFYTLHIIQSNTSYWLNYDEGQTPNIKCATDEDASLNQWAFFGNPYRVTVKNKAAGMDKQLASPSTQKVSDTGGNTYAVLTKPNDQANPDSVWRLYQAVANNRGQALNLSQPAFYLENVDHHRLNLRNSANNPFHLAYWTQGYGLGSAFIAQRATNTVTYNIVFDGKVVKQVTRRQTAGDAVAVPSDLELPGYATFEYSDSIIGGNTSEITATLKWNPEAPIQLSTKGNMHYFALNIRTSNTDHFFYYNKSQAGQDPNVSFTTSVKADDEYKWALVGNPYALTIYNKATGDTLRLSSKSTTGNPLGNDGELIHAVMTKDSATYPDNVWRLYPAVRTSGGQTLNDGGFYLENPQKHRLNFRNPTIAYWVNGYDQGSVFLPVSITIKPTPANQPVLPAGIYSISTEIEGNKQYASLNGNKELALSAEEPSTTSWHGLFLLRHSGDNNSQNYTIQDLETGRYLNQQNGNDKTIPSGSNAFNFVLKVDADIESNLTEQDTSKLWWNIYNNASAKAGDHAVWRATTDGKVQVWRVPDSKIVSDCDWTIAPVKAFTDAQIMKRMKELTHVSQPENGHVYRLVCLSSGSALYDRYNDVNAEVGTAAPNDSDYYQLWIVERNGNNVKIKNAISDKYITHLREYGHNQMLAKEGNLDLTLHEYKSDIPYTESSFSINSWDPYFALLCEGSTAICWDDRNRSNGGFRWKFVEVDVDSALLAKTRDDYQLRMDLRDNVVKYDTLMNRYFEDRACTRLRAAYKQMTTAEVKADMAQQGMLDALQRIVLKLKDSTWTHYESGRNWEEFFRIHKYQPWTDVSSDKWKTHMGLVNCWGNQTGPTGIMVKDNEMLYVFVDTIPAHASFAIETIAAGTPDGLVYPLKQGMNTVLTRGTANVFLRYWVDTRDLNDKGQSINSYTGKGPKLSEYPDVNVRIEGGTVTGMFDTTWGMKDSDWVALVKDNVPVAPSFNIKGEYSALHVRTSDAIGRKRNGGMEPLVEAWDRLLRTEDDLTGFRKDSTAVDHFRGLLEMNAVPGSAYYAISYGTHIGYDFYAGEVFGSDYTKEMGGGLWGPAHEFGHNHQLLIKLAGTTEISNNLFSNVNRFLNGTQASRYGENASVATLADWMASNRKWIQLDASYHSQMFFKLWLYYHGTKRDTTFYPRLFHELRVNRVKGPGGNSTGVQDYLKFALACCKVANENLEDYFRAWGFFEPVPAGTVVGDYQNTNMTTTQAMIDSTLTVMRQYPNTGAANSIIFINDAVRPTLCWAPHHEHDYRTTEWGGGHGFGGRLGDLGIYEAFYRDSLGYGHATASITANDDSTVTVAAKPNAHTIGYRVEDRNGNLVYFSNRNNFTIPQRVVEKAGGADSLFILACASNGTMDAVGRVNVNIGETEYATVYYSDRHLKVPAGVRAFTYKADNGSLAVDQAYNAGDIIPANTGVVLRAKAGRYAFEVADTFTQASEANVLLGTDTLSLTVNKEGKSDGKFYKLSRNANRDAGSVGFYFDNKDGKPFYNPSHKAYLVLQGMGANAKTAYLLDQIGFGPTTDIDRVLRAAEDEYDAPVYTLQGVRVSSKALKPGVYVKHGKKFIVK